MEVFSQQGARAGALRKFLSALRPESGKEEQSEELETNCEQMSGGIIRNVWKAHQDGLMRQKKFWARSSNSCRPAGEGAGRRNKPVRDRHRQQRNFCYASCPPAGTPARRHACCSAVVAQQHRIRMHDLNILAPVLPLIWQIGEMETGLLLLPPRLWLQTEREEGKVSDEDSS